MSIVKITGHIARISEITSRWAGQKAVSDIEREMVLDKLRTLYEEVMFYDRERDADESFPDAALEVDAEAAGEAAVFSAHAVAPSGTIKSTLDRKVVLALYEQPEETPSCEVAQAAAEDTLVAGEEAAITEVCHEIPAPATPQQGACAAEESEEPEEAKGAEEAKEIEEVASPTASVSVEASAENEPGLSAELSLFGAVAEPEAPASTAARKEPEAAAPKILGEVINAGAESLGDMLSKGAPAEDMAFKVASAQTESLRRSIGINDKFLIISEVFAGNAPAYEKAISDLDTFETLDDAMLYIHENYRWSPKNDGVKVLVDMLTRKLS